MKDSLQDYGYLREKMVNTQIISRGIKDPKVLEAIKKVPREKFVDKQHMDSAYEDRPLPIGMGQTISQPYIVALMTESLELTGSEKVLEIGTGSGYQTAVLAEIAKEVYSVEIVPSLFEKVKMLLKDYKNITISNHDGFSGWKEFAPFDRIIVTAAPDHIPGVFIDQLKDGGILVMPVGVSTWSQELYKVIKRGKNIRKIKICDVSFVSMTGKSF
ncbi:MAG: protein-L-isoaspartate(D-aspartate) O-methyltransferase [Actinobacteria bacterium]|nr:protein-L-isoaspartate(D-aspartate) O-methyltransferase [Actinomycetota bacterium]